MKKSLLLVLKGMIIGIANIIPGVSGGTLMVTLGIYDDVIDAISHFFSKFKKNVRFLLPLGIGMGLAILLLSKIISGCLDKFPFPTVLFFIGLILGGIPLLWNKVKIRKKKISLWLIFISTFAIVLTFTFIRTGNYVVDLNNLNLKGYLLLFIIGIVTSSTMIIPGISGSFVLMLAGYYEPIVNTISGLTNFSNLGHNIIILGIFGIGILIGIVLVAKIIEYLMKKFEVPTYFGVLGFVMASIIAIVKPIVNVYISPLQIVIGVVLLVWGFMVAYKIAK